MPEPPRHHSDAPAYIGCHGCARLWQEVRELTAECQRLRAALQDRDGLAPTPPPGSDSPVPLPREPSLESTP